MLFLKVKGHTFVDNYKEQKSTNKARIIKLSVHVTTCDVGAMFKYSIYNSHISYTSINGWCDSCYHHEVFIKQK